MGGVGLAENKANSAQLELEAGAELGNIIDKSKINSVFSGGLQHPIPQGLSSLLLNRDSLCKKCG